MEYPACTPRLLREATEGFGLHSIDEYFGRLPLRFHGVVVYLADEEWLDDPLFPPRLSHGESWVVIESGSAKEWPVKSRASLAAAAPSRVRSPRVRTAGPALRFQVLRRDGFRCQYCGTSAAAGAVLHVDHIVPFSAGGDTTESNLRTACRNCNLGKGAGRL